MHILHAYKDFDPPVHGGMERHIALMCRFQREWAEVEALTCSRSWRTQVVTRDGTRVTEVGEWGRFQGAPVSPLYPRYLRKLARDIAVVHVPNPTAEVGWLLARPRGRLVVRYHSDVVRQASAMRLYGPIQMQFLSQAAMIIATSEPYVTTSPVLQAVLAHAGAGKGPQMRVVPLGILTEEFQRPDLRLVAELRARYGSRSSGRYVLFSGKHRYYKGLEYLVRAAGAIQVPVVIAGDGPERPRLEALARELGLLGEPGCASGSGVQVWFPGALTQAELVAHLHGCEVFAFPSVARSEAFGLSILEAHAAGKPVVATRLGTGVEFANQHERTGLNVAPRDAQALAAAVNALLADTSWARRLGDFARQRVEKEFHAEQAARAEFDLFREVMACPNTGT